MNDLLHRINRGPLDEGMRMLPAHMDSLRARVLLLTTGLQESRFEVRDQYERGGRNTTIGPATGFWQFEQGGIRGVFRHADTRDHMSKVLQTCRVNPSVESVWRTITTPEGDALAAALARLNYYWDPASLPDIEDAEEAFKRYLFCWRPGAYKRMPNVLRAKWLHNHAQVLAYFKDIADER